MKKFFLFVGILALTITGLTIAADKDQSNILPVEGAGGNNLITNLNTAGNFIETVWSAKDSTFREPSILVFPSSGVADTFHIYLVTAPLGGVMVYGFKTVNFDSLHLVRTDSIVFLSAYVRWE